ncbi:MAG: site-specific integrase [Candidatus Nanopelagicales bacterium]|nr:site-specific integrase [Candidatus Nanopelagicales bacterium]
MNTPVISNLITSESEGLDRIARGYVRAATTASAGKCRARAAMRFNARFGSLAHWLEVPIGQRMAVAVEDRAYAAHAAVMAHQVVDAQFVVISKGQWGRHITCREPLAAAQFTSEAASLGFTEGQIRHMWSRLAQICVVTGRSPDTLSAQEYVSGRQALFQAATAERRATNALTTPLFGLDAVMFHRGQCPAPTGRRSSNPGHEIDWDTVAAQAPQLAATMRRYLGQIAISLRPGSVALIDTALRQLAGLLIAGHPDVTCVANISRQHIEAYRTWLVARPGYRRQPHLSKTTIGMRMGHLRGFFERIIEWGYDDIPHRIPVYSCDRPIKDTPLPRFLDDPTAAKFMAAARALPDPFDRLAIELLARTGMRKGELLALTIDAVVQIGSDYWLRTPVGKLHNDRYIPLHPVLKDMIDVWLADRPDWQTSNLLLTFRGRPIPQTRVDGAVRRAAAAAGIGHVHPHQLRHTLATQAINRGMSLEAIAALLGHKTMTMTMLYARIGDRTVAEEYFNVTAKVEALYHDPSKVILPAEAEGSAMAHLRTETHRLLGNGYCTRPAILDCQFETICESCTFFLTSTKFLPVLQNQRDDAACKGQVARQHIFDAILHQLDTTGT